MRVVAATVAEAVKIAMSEPRGPVHLDLREDVALATATETIPEIPSFAPIASASSESVNAGLDNGDGRRPMALFGPVCGEEIRAFVIVYRAPRFAFLHNHNGEGMIDEDHPMHRVH